MVKQQIIEAINRTKVQQIRAGSTHRFVDISIVEVNGRLFVRQYKFAKHSWYKLVNRAFHRKLPIIYTLMRWTFDTKKHEASTLELIPTLISH